CQEAELISATKRVLPPHPAASPPTSPASGEVNKLWGGRFTRGLLPDLERFASSLAVDYELYPYDVAGSIAHARGLAAARLLSKSQLLAIERGLRRIKHELDSGDFK